MSLWYFRVSPKDFGKFFAYIIKGRCKSFAAFVLSKDDECIFDAKVYSISERSLSFSISLSLIKMLKNIVFTITNLIKCTAIAFAFLMQTIVHSTSICWKTVTATIVPAQL